MIYTNLPTQTKTQRLVTSLDIGLSNNACQYIGRYGNSNMSTKIIQTQFVSVVSKVISDGIFN